jgi:hypothetical protein
MLLCRYVVGMLILKQKTFLQQKEKNKINT